MRQEETRTSTSRQIAGNDPRRKKSLKAIDLYGLHKCSIAVINLQMSLLQDIALAIFFFSSYAQGNEFSRLS